jgi:fatty acid desaturase
MTLNPKLLFSDPKVRTLLKTNNYIAARDLLIRVTIETLLILLVYCSVRNANYILAAALFYLLAIWHSFWGYAGIGHEFMHGRVFSNKSVNNLLYYFASILVWSNPAFFRDSHLYHHAKTFSQDDFEAYGVQKWRAVNIFSYLTIDLALLRRKIFYTVVNAFGKKLVNGMWLNIPRSHQTAASLILLVQIAIGVIIFYISRDFTFNLLWILLPFTAQLLNKILSQTQHMGLAYEREYGPLRHSRSIRMPKLISFLYAGMNFHAEHHLIPAIPYYNLPSASEYLLGLCNYKFEDWRQFFKNDFVPILRSICI